MERIFRNGSERVNSLLEFDERVHAIWDGSDPGVRLLG
jgi:hypothetical protein